jgi:hypothetical protein
MATPKINISRNTKDYTTKECSRSKITNRSRNSYNSNSSIQQNPPVLVVLEWDRTVIDMGVVAPGSKQKYEFNYLGTKKITDVKTSCGCTSALKNGGTISGVWTIGSDYSAVKEIESLTTRTVTATLNDGSKQVLTLKATVNKMYKIQK